MPNFVPISNEIHRDKHWVRHSNLLFAKAETVAPLYVNELAAAVVTMPIAFVKREDKFELVVLMGLKPGQNLFISPNGSWLARYLPVIYRNSPFELFAFAEQPDQDFLCIDEACITDTDQGEPFFDEKGEVTDAVKTVFEHVKTSTANRRQTQQVVAVLAEQGLLKPWPITINEGQEDVTINGLYQIDEQALNALSDEDYLTLRKVGGLPVAYSQLLSMSNLGVLINLIQMAARQAAAQQPGGESERTETFNFAGL